MATRRPSQQVRDGIFKLVRSPGIEGVNSASLCSLAGRSDNHIPTRFLAPMDCLKNPALAGRYDKPISIPFLAPIDSSNIRALKKIWPADLQQHVEKVISELPVGNVAQHAGQRAVALLVDARPRTVL
jgi:hypothetical protein